MDDATFMSIWAASFKFSGLLKREGHEVERKICWGNTQEVERKESDSLYTCVKFSKKNKKKH